MLLRAAVPAAVLLGAATLIGPLVFAVAAGTMAVAAGVATAGFFATAMLLPFMIFAGAGAAFFLGMSSLFFLPMVVSAICDGPLGCHSGLRLV
jgi:hypothetical protein